MSEPFSVASSAVGIVSLGLQVTQSLVTYYSQFKAFDSDIADISRKADGLHGILQVLEVPLRKFEIENATIPAQVRTAISASEEGLRNLNDWIEKYGKAKPPANIEDRLRLLRKRTLFPFRRDTLLGLKSTLQSLQSNLNTAIQVLHLDATQRQYDLVLAVSTAASAQTQEVRGHIQSQGELMESVSTRLDELVATIQQHQNQSSLLFREPALLATLCDSHHDLQRDTLDVLQSDVRQKLRKPISALSKGSFCSCKGWTRTSESYISTRYLSAFWSRKTQHLPCCPLYSRAERIDTLGAKYIYCSKALGNSIAVAISITRGAGGFAISPWLQFRAVISEDSPAFALLSFGSAFRTPGKDVEACADLILKQMYKLFQEGKASPTDVLSDGKTLLHAAIFWAAKPIYDQYSLFGLKYVPQLAALQKIIRTLVGAGAKAQERCTTFSGRPRTILHDLINMSRPLRNDDAFSTTLHGLVSDLLDYGLVFKADSMANISSAITSSLVVNNLVCSGHGSETIDVPQVFEQILLRSENGLKELLMRSPDSSNEVVGAQRTTPLHLSCLWPSGLSILLNAGAMVSTEDAYGLSPLAYACYSRCEESIQLLLDHDSGLGSIDDPNSCLSYICRIDNSQVRRSFISALVDRRERLRKFAALVLPEEESSRFDLNSGHLLDVQAADVTNAILGLGISVESALLPSPFLQQETVYHTSGLDASMADMLFEAGFRDTEGTDRDGLTPLLFHTMYLPQSLAELVSLIKWFISKGGDIYKEDPIRRGTALHRLAHILGRKTFEVLEAHEAHNKPPKRRQNVYLTLGEERRQTIIDFLTDPFEDSCMCACSKRGCRAISSTTKGLWGIWQPWSQSDCEPTRGISLRTPDGLFLMDTYTADFLEPERRRCPWLPHYILRVMTFDTLGLTHTCHQPLSLRSRRSEEDISEIQSEERFMIQQLESLMAEFDAKLSEVGGTLTSFLKGYWKPRMEEVLNTKDEGLDEEERRKMREIGVVLE